MALTFRGPLWVNLVFFKGTITQRLGWFIKNNWVHISYLSCLRSSSIFKLKCKFQLLTSTAQVPPAETFYYVQIKQRWRYLARLSNSTVGHESGSVMSRVCFAPIGSYGLMFQKVFFVKVRCLIKSLKLLQHKYMWVNAWLGLYLFNWLHRLCSKIKCSPILPFNINDEWLHFKSWTGLGELFYFYDSL